MRGYFGIGVYCPKNEHNIGTLWRSANIFGADFIFTIGRRYEHQVSDTMKTFRSVPLWNFTTFEEFVDRMPYTAQIICVELTEGARDLGNVTHPERAIYLLGAEDYGLPKKILEGREKIIIPTVKKQSLNVATAGAILMYDRFIKMRR